MNAAIVLCRTLINPTAIKEVHNLRVPVPISRDFICDYYPLSKIKESMKQTKILEYGVFLYGDESSGGNYDLHCKHFIDITFNANNQKKELDNLENITHITLSYSIKENNRDAMEIQKYWEQHIIISDHKNKIKSLKSKYDNITMMLSHTETNLNNEERLKLNTEIEEINSQICEHLHAIKQIEEIEHTIKYTEMLLENSVDLRMNEICRMKIYNKTKMAYDLFDFYWYIDKFDNTCGGTNYKISAEKNKFTTSEHEVVQTTKKLKRSYNCIYQNTVDE